MPSWMQALKIWNKDHGQWCIPRKDTNEYKEVIKIMNTGKQVVNTPVKNKLDLLYESDEIKKAKPKANYMKTSGVSIHDLSRIEQIVFDSGKKSGMSDNEIFQTIETRRIFRNTKPRKKREKSE